MKKFLLSLATLAVGFTTYAGQVTFDFTENNYGLQRYNNDDKNPPYLSIGEFITEDGVKITFDYILQDSSSDGGWRLWDDGLRTYYKRNAYFTVTTTNGEPVTGVSWTAKSGIKFALDGTTNAITSWTGNESSITFINVSSSNAAVLTITVSYGDDSIDDGPSIDVPDAPQGTINVADALSLIEAGYEGAAVVEGVITEITEISTQYGNATYIIKDAGASDDAEGLTVFRGYYLGGEKFTSEDQLQIGDEVIVSGDLVNYKGTYEFTTGNIILSLNGEVYEEPNEPGTPDTPGDDTIIFEETFASSLGDFTIDNVEIGDLNYVWNFDSKFGAKASAYFGGGNNAAESWLISPEIDLSDYTEITLSFNHAINYLNGEDVDSFCNVYVGLADQAPDEWTCISQQVNFPEGINWDFVSSGEISLNAFAGKSIVVGFLYTSTSAVAPTWEIKSFLVENKSANGVEEIGFDLDAPVEFYNLQGLKVANPVKGQIYILRQGKTVKKVIF